MRMKMTKKTSPPPPTSLQHVHKMTASSPAIVFPIMSPMESQSEVNEKSSAPVSKLKIYAVIIVIVSALVGATIILTVYFLRPAPPSPQVFHVYIDNEKPMTIIPMEIHLDKTEKIEYIIVPALDDNSSDSVYILRDYNKGITAHKDQRSGICFIGKLGATFDERSQLLENEMHMRFNGSQRMIALNDTIDPEVLSFTAGERVADFCDPLPARWMIRDNSDDDEEDDSEKIEGENPPAGSRKRKRSSSSRRLLLRRQRRFGWWGWGGGWGRGGWGGSCRCYPVCFFFCYRSCVYGC